MSRISKTAIAMTAVALLTDISDARRQLRTAQEPYSNRHPEWSFEKKRTREKMARRSRAINRKKRG